MEGSVRKRGTKWYYRYRDYDGKQVERVGGNTKKEALCKLNEEINRKNRGYSRPAEMKLSEYLLFWLEEYIKPFREENTYLKYKRDINNRINPIIGSIPLCNIKAYHIEQVLKSTRKLKNNKGTYLSETTIQKYYGVINTALNRAVKLQYIIENPCKYVDPPKRKKYTASILTIDEYKKIYNSLDCNKFNDYIFKLALNITVETGLRRGEMCGLCWSDIDFKNNTIFISKALKRVNNKYTIGDTKNHHSRTLPISDSLVDQLKHHKKLQNELKLRYGSHYIKNFFDNIEYDLIFTEECGKYITPSRFLQRIKRKCKYENINKIIRWHDLRHTNATLLIKQGVNMKIIQERLGHTQFSTTADIYSHVTQDMNRDATLKIMKLLK